ncbi:hypothetical protein ACFV2H_48560 [Streptomyces sp. NPDC059629]|uniref:hypothetical protein n=1 Tax=Streptomyces sp. NPDC059629 TaxID=3346889 RepID=UPI00368D51B0
MDDPARAGASAVPQAARLGLPADFLIAPDGRILAAKYGEHAYDQWSVDHLLELATQTSLPSGPRPEGAS